MEQAETPNVAGGIDIEKNLLLKQLTEMQTALLSWQAVALLALMTLGESVTLTEEFVNRIIAGEIEVKVEQGEEENTLIYDARIKDEETTEEDVEEESVPTFDSEPDSE